MAYHGTVPAANSISENIHPLTCLRYSTSLPASTLQISNAAPIRSIPTSSNAPNPISSNLSHTPYLTNSKGLKVPIVISVSSFKLGPTQVHARFNCLLFYFYHHFHASKHVLKAGTLCSGTVVFSSGRFSHLISSHLISLGQIIYPLPPSSVVFVALRTFILRGVGSVPRFLVFKILLIVR